MDFEFWILSFGFLHLRYWRGAICPDGVGTGFENFLQKVRVARVGGIEVADGAFVGTEDDVGRVESDEVLIAHCGRKTRSIKFVDNHSFRN